MLGPKILKTEVTRKVILGRKIFSNLSEILNELHLGENGLVIQGKSDFEFELKETVEEISSGVTKTKRKIELIVLKTLEVQQIEYIIETIKTKQIKFIIVIGNAKTIEFVKYIIKQLDKHIEWISVPTSPEHDGFASPFVFLDDSKKGEKFYGFVKPPIAILADINIIENSSRREIQSGIGILLSKYTSNWDWKLASRLRSEPISDFGVLIADELVKIQSNNFNLATFNPNNPSIALSEILKGLIISGFLSAFSNNLRAVYGSEHMFAQALDSIESNKTLRGERVALGTIMMASLQGQDWRQIRDHLKSAGIPISASELNIKNSSIVKALLLAINYSKSEDNFYYTILGEKGLTEDSAFRLVYRTGIIGNRPGLE